MAPVVYTATVRSLEGLEVARDSRTEIEMVRDQGSRMQKTKQRKNGHSAASPAGVCAFVYCGRTLLVAALYLERRIWHALTVGSDSEPTTLPAGRMQSSALVNEGDPNCHVRA